MNNWAMWLLGALAVGCVVLHVVIGRKVFRSERDEMALAKAVKKDDFQVWEAECAKLQRLADELGPVTR